MGTVSDKLTYLAATKAAIKNAIIEKGQTVEDSDTFRSYAEKIAAIETGGDVNIERLDVYENGTYSETGVAYSPVVVNVQPDLDTLDVSSNGTYTAPSGTGYDTVYVNVQSEVESLDVSSNGTYTAPSGTGYSPVYVNVEATQITGTMPDGNEYIIEKDPTTGEYITDSTTGEIVQTKVPSSIEITTEPTRKAYEDGDEISFTGLVVTLKDGNGNVFTDNAYPDGIIPNAQLTFPVTVAEYPDDPDEREYDPETATCIVVPKTQQEGDLGNGIYFYQSQGSLDVRAVYLRNGNTTALFFASSSNDWQVTAKRGNYSSSVNYNITKVIDGVTYYGRLYNYQNADWNAVKDRWVALGYPIEDVNAITTDNGFYYTFGEDSYLGDIIQEVPVKWTSGYNSKVLSDSFEITVSEASEEEPEEEPENE